MRSHLMLVPLVGLQVLASCTAELDDGPPFDDEFPVSRDNINEGAPPNDSIPIEDKGFAAAYGPQFEVGLQSPVKSQGSRGVCSIFAATALVEHLYIKAGMPVADADFSEQYMQWATKNQWGAFRNTEGSSAEANLQMVARYGAVKEWIWPYQSSPWTTANDPACTGSDELDDGLPTRCYTNGEPPSDAASAEKFLVPVPRYINTASIKEHLSSTGTAVNVGMKFFFQAWNHRRSTLPIDHDLWARGIVTYPNDKDKAVSPSAGHTITIVGWDDDLEVPMRDGDGKHVLDGNGNPMTEKGFFIFKNSWGTSSFGVDHPSGAGYGYLSYRYVDEYGSAIVADLPAYGTGEVCDDAAGVDEDHDGKANCEDPECAASPACAPPTTSHVYDGYNGQMIPDDSPEGATSIIGEQDSGTIDDVKVTVDITHTWRGDLRLTLSHNDFTQVIFDREGGSADDLKQTFVINGMAGLPLDGNWTLKVEDMAAQDVGTFNMWTVEVTAH